ncbi:hypothetical protein [Psychroserpens sp. SPM9]|uniref:hypothetical protein n=1 Tax=Psychroserpens sp. SPM9 TaxID=2975598 RepID=UPI0021A5B679|nr:hypothetical protein [Psychroserpens sp. SPM9]MDG5490631.1 hypothetical protein [Psychroserpens sp. SPM9]MDG5490637.1 hypothetical protein [Psychroserpens sp. SPM9]
MKIINKALIIILSLASIFSCSQEIKCDDFKKGRFVVPNDTEGTTPYRIIRSDTTQVEIDSEGVKRYSKLKWLNDCSYVIFYDADKMPLTDFQKEVNSVGGIIVEVTKIEDSCFYYTSNIKGDDDSERIDGIMCKE